MAHPAAMAINWKRILLTDAGVGLVFVAIGVALMAVWWPPAGAAVAAFGCCYEVLVFRRYKVWKAQRIEAGLPV